MFRAVGISSAFDFLTFFVLLHVFGAGEVLFHTGWFIASLTAQILVVLSIRTRRWFFRSRPHLFLIGTVLSTTSAAILLPLLPIGRWFGFTPPSYVFFVYVVAATASYFAVVEMIKGVFYAKSPPRTLGMAGSGD